MKNRIISAVLLISALIGLVGCQGGSDKNGTSNSTSGASDTTAAPVDDSPKLELPADADFGGETFTIYMTTEASYEYAAEEQTGDVVNDAVYNRNQTVEELLNVDFDFVDQPGYWGDRATFNATITNSILAGDGAFDLISGVTVIVLPLAAEGYFLNAAELNYIDFDKPWWVQGMMDDLAIDGKLCGFIGDASLSLYKDLAVIFFNKQIAEDYNLPNPYDYVRQDNWNIETFGGMLKDISSDLNSDGKLSWGDDMLGFMTNAVPNRAFMTATEMNIISYNNGTPEFGTLSERSVDIFGRLYSLFMENENVIINPQDEYDVATQHFTEDKALFMDALLRCADNMRNMKSDFGILPYPKADENQSNYHTQIGTSTSMMFIPNTAKNPDMTAMVCEALSYYSMLNVVPTYYEIALKEKYTRDEDVKEMLEIIRSSATMDFTFAYSTMFEPFPNCLTEFRKGATNNIASTYDTNVTKWKATLEDILEKYEALE